MFFVGREKETKKILRAIEQCRNVIVTGKFGMGRTGLLRHISDVYGKRWRFIFVDFSKTPNQVCTDILAELSPGKRNKHVGQDQRYKVKRHRITTVKCKDARPIVLVLDNIEKLTRQRLALIRYLSWEKSFFFIAITESFLHENDSFLLRAELLPECIIRLGRVNRRKSIEFFKSVSEGKKIAWTADQICMLAETTRGYPLGMQEIAEREMKK